MVEPCRYLRADLRSLLVGRAAGCVTRIGHYLAGGQCPVWHLLYADDGCLISDSKPADVRLLLQLFIMEVLGVPVA